MAARLIGAGPDWVAAFRLPEHDLGHEQVEVDALVADQTGGGLVGPCHVDELGHGRVQLDLPAGEQVWCSPVMILTRSSRESLS